MEAYIYVCPKCDSAYGKTGEGPHTCSSCGTTLLSTGMTDPEWYAMKRPERVAETKKLIAGNDPTVTERVARAARINAAVKDIILTTSQSVEGYRIVKYIDVYFEEIVVGFGLSKSLSASFDTAGAIFTGTEAIKVRERMDQIKMLLRERVIEKAAADDADAIIAIDFEKSSIGDLFMVSMSGAAVKLEKIE